MAEFYNYIEICVALDLHASKEEPITASALETLYDIQQRKTEALIRRLVQNNIVSSIRGHYGGYYIDNAHEVTLLQIYNVYNNAKKSKDYIFTLLKDPLQNYINDIYSKSLSDCLAGKTLYDISSQYNLEKLPNRQDNNFTYYI
ncbi:MAG: Rrf2 family transcriptional regulator [Pseudomonadota bacterium]